ncbi:tRNA (uridine(54)-C5)-methyltransferase TrmA [Marinobacterium weihaiense]|uniref:tRNA/tmRNA (uracil-C(5))-methyltransferase n=1 Tax=Marinobacterium weihaiense TaxID=2851016 RepID=A0ABS6MAR4_9GAMM|nr:tRNA (uridine(54)-C5)-methyltransferase TrmA [Marinobacterium weihaiense]MBV0932837.1 tRNA (uridine(54)-C5)-methyltransferase TrmA [Marinobacterium weihaiense]
MALPRVEPEQYDALLAAKKARIADQFAEFDLPEIEVFTSQPQHYRLRAEFRTWHEGDDLYYVMFDGDKRTPVRLDNCPMVSERIHDMMFKLLDVIRPDPVLRFKLFQIDFLSTLSGELLVSLLYHRQLDDEWVERVKPLREQFNIDIIGRARKQKILLDRDFVVEELNIKGRPYRYQQTENGFTQPNGHVCEKMIEWAIDVSSHAGGDLVEFYCGNGNFTLPLAQNFRRVVATEISKVSVRSAEWNIQENGIDNIDVLRMPSEDLSLILKGEKTSRKVQGLALDECEFSTVFVDPPRCGLDEHTVEQICEYEHILYISCNPDTLHDNLQQISKTHKLERFAIFDQFPYTDHLECGVYLTRR